MIWTIAGLLRNMNASGTVSLVSRESGDTSMIETAVRKTMARNDLAVKMGVDVVKKARVVALNRNITLAEYLTETIRPLVDKDYAVALAEMTKEAKAQGLKGGSK
jgi:hypothetical protein